MIPILTTAVIAVLFTSWTLWLDPWRSSGTVARSFQRTETRAAGFK